MNLNNFLDKYPVIKEKYYKDQIVQLSIDEYVHLFGKHNINERELLYQIFVAAISAKEKIESCFKEHLESTPLYKVWKEDN